MEWVGSQLVTFIIIWQPASFKDMLLKYATSRGQFESLVVTRIFLQLCS
jgi:hypothetical protein